MEVKIPNSIKRVIESVSIEFSVDPEMLLYGQRRIYVHARAVVAYKLYKKGHTLKQIGLWLGARDHTTILYYIQKFEKEKEQKDQGEIPIPDYSGEWAI